MFRQTLKTLQISRHVSQNAAVMGIIGIRVALIPRAVHVKTVSGQTMGMFALPVNNKEL
tara:strand:+ start:5696 stop:5872 length:177 start_codon:yes stop_codon:yes gene_type:complete